MPTSNVRPTCGAQPNNHIWPANIGAQNAYAISFFGSERTRSHSPVNQEKRFVISKTRRTPGTVITMRQAHSSTPVSGSVKAAIYENIANATDDNKEITTPRLDMEPRKKLSWKVNG